jgi:hypothetical protein
MSNQTKPRRDAEPLIAVQLSDTITLHVSMATLARIGLRDQPSRSQPRRAQRSRPPKQWRRKA